MRLRQYVNAGQPQEICHKRIGRAHQFAVFLPILRVGMMCEMHDLIVISWKDHHKANQPAKEHIYPAGRKNGRMAQLMLGGIEEIEQNTQDKACQPDPCSAQSQAVQVTRARRLPPDGWPFARPPKGLSVY